MTRVREEDDQEAFALVVDRCHHLVRAAVLRETADTELADELAQETLVRAWTKRQQYRPGTSPRAWLLAIVRSQLMEHHRRRSRDRRHLQQLVTQELLRHRQTISEDPVAELNEARLGALRHCLSELPERHREMLDLVHGQGLSTEDAAACLGIKSPTCRQRLSRLQRALRSCAEERLQGSGDG
mgnify:CR=1 FL=1